MPDNAVAVGELQPDFVRELPEVYPPISGLLRKLRPTPELGELKKTAQVCQQPVLASSIRGIELRLNISGMMGPFFVGTVWGCRVDTIQENAGCSQKKEGHTVMCPFSCHFVVATNIG
jgi:hypothetical protein